MFKHKITQIDKLVAEQKREELEKRRSGMPGAIRVNLGIWSSKRNDVWHYKVAKARSSQLVTGLLRTAQQVPLRHTTHMAAPRYLT